MIYQCAKGYQQTEKCFGCENPQCVSITLQGGCPPEQAAQCVGQPKREFQEIRFESTAPAIHDFGHVLRALKCGQRAARAGWQGLSVELQKHAFLSKMSHDYLFLNYADGKMVPWAPTQTDILASDWAVIPSPEVPF